MKKAAPGRALQGGFALSVIAVLTACGTPPPEDFSGSWQPVNRYHETPAEIPLSPVYLFYATPIDETLKTMLGRWAADSGLKLSYQFGSDFTLYRPVTRIRTTDIQAATSELTAIYAAQGLSITADDKQIRVRPASAIQAEPPPDASGAAAPPAPTH